MKYIIEIEDEPFVRLSALFGEEGLYRAKGFNSLVFDRFGLDKLTPLDKELEEAYQKGFEVGQHEATTLEYQQGLNDAWEAARTIVWNTSLNDWKSVGVDIGEWGGDESEALNRYSVSEVIEILKKMGKPNHDEIKVGDEVIPIDANCREDVEQESDGMSNERVVSESYESMYKNAVHQFEEQEKTIEILKKNLQEAEARADYFEREKEKNSNYLKGMIDGLKFAVRCNGVSGAEVQ